MITIDKEAVRFIYTGGQVNCHWFLLNPFSGKRFQLRGIRNFFYYFFEGLKEVLTDHKE